MLARFPLRRRESHTLVNRRRSPRIREEFVPMTAKRNPHTGDPLPYLSIMAGELRPLKDMPLHLFHKIALPRLGGQRERAIQCEHLKPISMGPTERRLGPSVSMLPVTAPLYGAGQAFHGLPARDAFRDHAYCGQIPYHPMIVRGDRMPHVVHDNGDGSRPLADVRKADLRRRVGAVPRVFNGDQAPVFDAGAYARKSFIPLTLSALNGTVRSPTGREMADREQPRSDAEPIGSPQIAIKMNASIGVIAIGIGTARNRNSAA